jgi:hypothetical protein
MPSCDGLSIHLEQMETAWYGRGGKTHAICGACLEKLGVPEMLAEHEEYERRMNRKSDIDVSPKQVGRGSMRLISGGSTG